MAAGQADLIRVSAGAQLVPVSAEQMKIKIESVVFLPGQDAVNYYVVQFRGARYCVDKGQVVALSNVGRGSGLRAMLVGYGERFG